MSFTIGSLFDGSGGFPLAAFMCGGTPVWASEIEPYPIAVTKTRFPYMKHLGSVTDIKGNEIEPVDVITFGSPCQDLSVAGKRAGLKHTENGDEETTRSGLFMDAVRIIKEMREATNGKYPRFAVWENVPGAFSSNKGEDFRIVLEELIKIVEPNAVMPGVPKSGWNYADHFRGDGWSLAYRVFDAQYWGVPQRRRRIYLVADFRGECAGEVSFEREGLRGYFETGRTPRKEIARNAENRSGTDDRGGIAYTLKIRGGCSGGGKGALIQTDRSATLSTLQDQTLFQPILDDQGGSQISVRHDGKCPTLRAEMHGNIPCVLESAGFKELNSAKARSDAYEHEIAPCLSANKHDASVCVKCYDARGNGDGSIAPTITGDHNNRITDYTCVCCEPIPIHDQATRFSGKRGDNYDGKGNGLGVGNSGDPMNTITSGDRHAVAYGIGNGQANQPFMEEHVGALNCMHDQQAICYGVDSRNATEYPEMTGALQADAAHNLNSNNVVRVKYIVRRLTPTECARLQGFPDRWATPDKKDSFTDEEYKFWLNVRNTKAEIDGKATKEYTKTQMLTWYNKLHTDSAEYKLWGNGIALPCALYVMQGIAEVFS